MAHANRSLQGRDDETEIEETVATTLEPSRKAIMSPMCKSGMSLSPRDKLRTSRHGMGDDERAGFEPHRSSCASAIGQASDKRIDDAQLLFDEKAVLHVFAPKRCTSRDQSRRHDHRIIDR